MHPRFLTCLKLLVLLVLLGTTSGCLMCCNPMYDAYPAYGGAWERTDRFQGRVGSILEPAGVLVEAGAESEQATPSSTEDQQTPREAYEYDSDPLPPLPDELLPADPAGPLETGIR